MTAPKFVDDLPGTSPVGAAEPNQIAAIVQTAVALSRRPGQWAEIHRCPRKTPGGHPNANANAKARQWRSYGLDAEVRSDGDEYVVYARVPAVTA